MTVLVEMKAPATACSSTSVEADQFFLDTCLKAIRFSLRVSGDVLRLRHLLSVLREVLLIVVLSPAEKNLVYKL